MHEQPASLRERTGGAAHASRTASPIKRLLRGLLLAVVGGVFLAFTGAFGSGEAPYLQRLGYWVTVMVAGGLIGSGVSELFDRRGWLEARPWAQVITVALAITAPLTPLVWAITTAWFGRSWDIGELARFLPPVVLISLVMSALNHIVDRRPPETHAAAPGAAPPRFLERLPFKLKGASIYAVEAEDHYLRIHTDRGSDLILMRLADAVVELEGLEGAQTHRSWWVAKDAVADASRGDGRAVLTLKNGARAPVSRTYAKALRESGWF